MTVPGPNNRYFKVVRGVIYGWIVLLVLALYPYTEDPATPIKTLISALAAVVAVSVWALGVVVARVPWRTGSMPIYLLTAFLVAQTVIALGTSTPQRSFYAIAPWLIYGVLAFLVYQAFPHTRQVRNLMRVIVASVTVSSIYGMLQYGGFDPFPWALHDVEEYRALPATYGHPNFAGHALVVAILLCGGLCVDAWRRGKGYRDGLIYVMAALVLLTHLYLTHMRGAIVALFVAAVVAGVGVLIWRRGATPLRAWRGGLLAGGGALVGGVLLGAYLVSNVPLESSLQLRLHSMANGAALFLDHPAIGVGPGNYAFENIPYWSDFEALWYGLEAKRNQHVHNEILEIAAESGVVGLFLFVLLCLHRIAIPRPRTGPLTPLGLALTTALVAMVVDGFFGFNLHVPVSGAFFFILLLVLPDDREWGETPVRVIRGTAPLMLIVPGLCLPLAIGNFASERAYQQGQGALAWARSHPTEAESVRLPATAYALFQEAQSMKPWDYRAPLAMGDLALQTGHAQGAIIAYESALSHHPHLPRLQLQLARAYLQVATTTATRDAHLDTAEGLVDGVLERCPALGEAHALRGWIHWATLPELEGPQSITAQRALVQAFDAARQRGMNGDGPMEFALGQGYRALGDRGKAMGALLRAIAASPSTADYWSVVADLAEEKEDFWRQRFRQTAIFHVARENDLPPSLRGTLAHRLANDRGDAATRSVVGTSLIRALEIHPEALSLWTAWLQTVPSTNQALILSRMVARLEEGGDVPRAMVSLRDALKSPTDIAALTKLADSLAWTPTMVAPETPTRDAGVVAERVSAHPVHHGDHAVQLGRLYFYGGAWDRAERELRLAATSVPADQLGEVNYYLSRILAHRGEGKAALSLAREALQSDRPSVMYQWNYALRLAEVGEVTAARFQLETLFAQTSGRAELQAPIAEALQALDTLPGGTHR